MKRRTVLASLSLLPTLALAQGAYPTRAITMIVPFPPGGLADWAGLFITAGTPEPIA